MYHLGWHLKRLERWNIKLARRPQSWKSDCGGKRSQGGSDICILLKRMLGNNSENQKSRNILKSNSLYSCIAETKLQVSHCLSWIASSDNSLANSASYLNIFRKWWNGWPACSESVCYPLFGKNSVSIESQFFVTRSTRSKHNLPGTVLEI